MKLSFISDDHQERIIGHADRDDARSRRISPFGMEAEPFEVALHRGIERCLELIGRRGDLGAGAWPAVSRPGSPCASTGAAASRARPAHPNSLEFLRLPHAVATPGVSKPARSRRRFLGELDLGYSNT